jgi:hypothetical protein
MLTQHARDGQLGVRLFIVDRELQPIDTRQRAAKHVSHIDDG